jgi:hypothetical protein
MDYEMEMKDNAVDPAEELYSKGMCLIILSFVVSNTPQKERSSALQVSGQLTKRDFLRKG